MRPITIILHGSREDRDLKQSDIANLIGTTWQQYSKCETGESELPIRALVILSDYHNVSADYLLRRTECKDIAAVPNEPVPDGRRAALLRAVSRVRAGGGPYLNMPIYST